MRLKHIKLVGFKSFVDSTKVPFEHQMTAIVGPNGCGKSNIIDAVRWVLGESSAKNLRGDSMTDVIFNGSTSRKPIGQASVELVFEKSKVLSQKSKKSNVKYQQQSNAIIDDHFTDSMEDRNEISIRRLVNRDSVNTYYLNGSKCRRRDITDIFLGTGLGPKSYAIIEQGTISRLIESKPQDLRIFIEEAAGISKYKERRRETETRIRHTRENLVRLSDIRSELNLQIDKLHQQAQAAKRFKTLKASERKYKAELAALKWQTFDLQCQQYFQKVKKSQQTIEDLTFKFNKLDVDLFQSKQLLEQGNKKVSNFQTQKLDLSNDITRLEQKIKHNLQEQANVERDKGKLKQQLLDAQKVLLTEQQQLISIAEILTINTPILAQIEQSLTTEQSRLNDEQKKYLALQSNWQKINEVNSQFLTDKALIENQIIHQKVIVEQSQVAMTKLVTSDKNLPNMLSLSLIEKKQSLIKQFSLRIESSEKQNDRLLKNIKALQNKQMNEQQHQAKLQGLLQALDISLQQKKSSIVINPDWIIEQKRYLQELAIEQQGQFFENIKVKPGWENAVEQVLTHLLRAQLVDSFPKELLIETICLVKNQTNTEDALVGTLAEMIIGENAFISRLNTIHLAPNYEKARQVLPSLPKGHSVICKDGTWLAENYLIKGDISFSNTESNSDSKTDSKKDKKDGRTNSRPLQQLNDIDIIEEEICLAREELTRGQLHNVTLSEQIDAAIVEQKELYEGVNADRKSHLEDQQNLLLLQQEFKHQQSQKAKNLVEQQEVEQRLTEQNKHLQSLTKKEKQLMTSAPDESHLIDLTVTMEQLQNSIENKQLQSQQLNNQRHEKAIAVEQVKSQHLHCTKTIERLQTEIAVLINNQAIQQQQIEGNVNPQQDNENRLQLWLNQMSELDQQLQKLQLELVSSVEKAARFEEEKLKATNRINHFKDKISRSQLEGESYRLRAETALEQIAELQQTLEDVLEQMPQNAKEGIWQAHIARLTKDISLLGAINLAAIDEYESQFERKTYLDQQDNDLNQAISTLEAAINKIDKESRDKFKTTFDKVNSGLKELFPKVFGGGSAYLDLTDSDLLNTGVTIMARPPGKKNSTIHLLSGGEKALTALSLVFAIFKLNPAPFCMLDEVDAPLDDANVERFCNLVSEMSQSVQFIYISHNKIAMEMARTLTGVTMFEPGVSKMVAVDIDEAIAMAEIS